MCLREQVYGVECLNLVGGATSAVEYAGPTICEAAECVGKHGMVRPWIDGWPLPPMACDVCAPGATGAGRVD